MGKQDLTFFRERTFHETKISKNLIKLSEKDIYYNDLLKSQRDRAETNNKQEINWEHIQIQRSQVQILDVFQPE